MKIVHVVENLNRGGLERVVIDLVLAQIGAGHDCRVLCVFEEGLLASELVDRGVRVDACRKRDGVDPASLLRMRHLLREDGADVIHSHNVLAHDYAVLASRGSGVRTVLNTRHGMAAAGAIGVRGWLYRRSMRHTYRVATVCEAARAILVAAERLPAARVIAVPNGIRVAEFETSSAAARERLKSMFGIPAAARVIGFVGRLNWAKDLPTLIEAFARVRERMPEVVLVVAGGGDLRAELEARSAALGLQAHVRFLGDRSDVRQLLPGFDLFAMSSVTEGYSIALLEACASALPIVATDVGGNAEIVRDGINGRIVPPQDPAAFSDALESLLRAPAMADAMGQAGRAWVMQHGTLDGMVGTYQALYERMVAAR